MELGNSFKEASTCMEAQTFPLAKTHGVQVSADERHAKMHMKAGTSRERDVHAIQSPSRSLLLMHTTAVVVKQAKAVDLSHKSPEPLCALCKVLFFACT